MSKRNVERVVRAHAKLGGLLHRLVGSTDARGAGTEFAIPHVGPFVLVEDVNGIEGPDQPPFGPHPHAGLVAVTWVPGGDPWTSPTNVPDVEPEEVGAEDVLVTFTGRGVVHDERTTGEGRHELFQIILRLPRSRWDEPAWLAKRRPRRVDETLVCVFDTGTLEGTDVSATAFHGWLPADARKTLSLDPSHDAFLYVRAGSATIADQHITTKEIALLGSGSEVVIEASEQGCEFFLGAGEPIDEPWTKLLGHEGFVIAASEADADARLASFAASPETFGQ